MAEIKQAAVTVVINNEDKILFVKRSNNVRSYKGYWGFPGGGVDSGEEPEQAAARELQEETGLKTPVEHLSYIGKIIFNSTFSVLFFATRSFEGSIILNEESDGFAWLTLEEFKAHKVFPVMYISAEIEEEIIKYLYE